MKLFIEYIESRYERLFTRRHKLENECDPPAVEAERRGKFGRPVFPTQPVFPRYQY